MNTARTIRFFITIPLMLLGFACGVSMKKPQEAPAHRPETTHQTTPVRQSAPSNEEDSPAGAKAGATRVASDDDLNSLLNELDRMFDVLSGSTSCESMCKALQSMKRAAARICVLTKDDAGNQNRCELAQDKVKKAEEQLKARGCHC